MSVQSTPDISGSANHEYRIFNLQRDVVLRLEFISAGETRVCR